MSAVIQYVKGDATVIAADVAPTAIVHCVNDVGAWGAGFVLSLGKRYPIAREAYLAWSRGGLAYQHRKDELRCFISAPRLQLGEVQIVSLGGGNSVVNLCGQHDVGVRPGAPPPVRYEAIEKGLRRFRELAALVPGTRMQCPRFGAGLAGGKWETIEAIIQREIADHGMPVTVFDL